MDVRVCGDPNSAMRFAFIEFTTEQSALWVRPRLRRRPCMPEPVKRRSTGSARGHRAAAVSQPVAAFLGDYHYPEALR